VDNFNEILIQKAWKYGFCVLSLLYKLMRDMKNNMFSTNSVRLYLSIDWPYASTCFATDMVKYGSEVSAAVVSMWFSTYFPSPIGWLEYKKMKENLNMNV